MLFTAINTYHAMGRFSRWQTGDIFLFFPEKKIWHFMQIVSLGDNLHEVSYLIFEEKFKKYFKCRLLKVLPSMQSVKACSR